MKQWSLILTRSTLVTYAYGILTLCRSTGSFDHRCWIVRKRVKYFIWKWREKITIQRLLLGTWHIDNERVYTISIFLNISSGSSRVSRNLITRSTIVKIRITIEVKRKENSIAGASWYIFIYTIHTYISYILLVYSFFFLFLLFCFFFFIGLLVSFLFFFFYVSF